MLVTSVGIGKYKIIYKKGDMMLECSLCFSDCGYSFVSIMNQVNKKMNEKMPINICKFLAELNLIHFFLEKTAVCHKTGKTATLCMERYCEMSGTYKPVSYSGTKEVCAAMGKCGILNIVVDFAPINQNDDISVLNAFIFCLQI